ncbi:unnamed protein product [Heterobilharzia americana]|nr:unnamed protein product [Heterobilharzia americana]
MGDFVSMQTKRYAGHAHWQNVKHIKEAGDREKSKNSLYYIKAIHKAIREGGGIRDPKLNSGLAAVLAEAKSKSIPLATLGKQLNEDCVTDPYLIEIRAPGGLFVIIESRAKQVSLERQRMGAVIKRYGCSLTPVGDVVTKFFDHVGLVTVPGTSVKQIPDLDAATNLGIEVGAKELSLDNDDVYINAKKFQFSLFFTVDPKEAIPSYT